MVNPLSTRLGRVSAFFHGANSVSTANVTRTFILSRGSDCAPGSRWQISVLFVPIHGATERRADRACRETQFTSGLRAIHEHFVPGNFHAFDGNLRLAAENSRNGVFGVSVAERDAVRNFQSRRGRASDFRERVEDLLEREIFRAEQIAFADAALFGDEEMARGGIFPVRKSTMIFPVGVGFQSPGPTGVVGIAITAGNPDCAAFRTSRSASHLERL